MARWLQQLCRQAYAAEAKIIDWIFRDGELDFLRSDVIKEFLKDRFNRSLKSIGIDPAFATDEALIAQTEWFDDEIYWHQAW